MIQWCVACMEQLAQQSDHPSWSMRLEQLSQFAIHLLQSHSGSFERALVSPFRSS